MSRLEKVIYLTKSQYDTLAAGGSVTTGTTTLTGIEDDYLYITNDPDSITDLTGILQVNHGGTGLTSIAQNSLIIGDDNGGFITIAKSTSISNQSTNNELPTGLAVYNYVNSYASPKAGSTSITTVGTVTSGVWQGTAIASSYIGSHNHSGNNITSGTVSASYLPTMGAASSSAAGSAGIVPASAAGDQVAFLQGDATWYKLNVRNGTGTNSIIIGNSGRAVGNGSVAEGTNTYASGTNAHAEGEGFSSFVDYFGAIGNNSHSEGAMTTASGAASHAEGGNTEASGGSSHAEGSGTEATALAAHAEGSNTTASGYYAHAEGYKTIANHKSQHVFGEFNIGDTSTAENTARGTYIEIVGKGTGDQARSNARTLDWSGNETLAGNLTINGTTLTLGNISITATQLQTLVNLTAVEGVSF